MLRLVPERFAEPLDYPGRVDDRKLASRKDEKLADFRWVAQYEGVESRTQILAHGIGGSRIVRRGRESKIRAATRVSSDLVSATIAMMMEASYTCDSCGEEIVIPIDLSAGSNQEYVEDCPVCCSANVIQVMIGDDRAYVSAHAE